MSMIKTAEEIEIMRQGGAILSRVLGEVVARIVPGAITLELDELAERRMREAGGEPSFKGYKTRGAKTAFPSSLCISINDEVVHAPATPSRALKEGDITGLDIGVRYKGYCTDMAVTIGVGKVSREAKRLMSVTRDSLMRGVSAVKPGNFVSDIGKAVQGYAEKNGFSIVRDLVGHGVGKGVHEEPKVPNYFDEDLPPVELKPGLVIAIEPMVNVGDCEVRTLGDGWTIVTSDCSLSAHFEMTVAVTDIGYEILTPLPRL
ncbi:type I methionyl aminopeptidase [Candidatus Uhrbacteria bacterium]|nr:type I methionyl aminopeptidase [Candidatus Uhrbacteria bacterium]